MKNIDRFILTILILVSVTGVQAAGKSSTAYYKKIGPNSYLISLSVGAKLVESLKAFQKATGILSGSATGVGVLKNTTVGQYRFLGDPLVNGKVAEAPKFPNHDDVFIEGNREMVGLTCLLTTNLVKGNQVTKTDPHCHVALAGADDPAHDSDGGYKVVGGHLVEGEIGVIGEIFVTAYPTAINKKSGGELGGSILDLDESQGGIALN